MKFFLTVFLAGLALAAVAQETSTQLASTEVAGRELAARLRSLQPAEGITNTAVLRIRTKTNTTEFPLRVEVSLTDTNWSTRYLVLGTNASPAADFRVTRTPLAVTEYWFASGSTAAVPVAADALQVPFAGSDFWLADLGMEFLHWPTQRLLKKEIRRGQSCDKLESVAPVGQTNGYVRVVSWFDIDTGGPVICEAYDAAGRLVKEFKPNDFSKVNGQWQVEELEMRDERTGSRSFIRFILKN